MASRQGYSTIRHTAWLALCLLAIFFMLALEVGHLAGPGTLADLCQFGGTWSCEETMAHPAAVFLTLPVPVWAVAGYSLLLWLGPATWHDRRRRRLAGAAVVGLVLISLFFVRLMERDFSKPCPFCLAAHLCHLLLLVVFLSTVSHPRSTAELSGPRQPSRLPWAIPLLILLAGALLFGRLHERQAAEAKARYLTSPDLLADVLLGNFDRHFPALPEQRISGPAAAPFQLVIIGSLSCSHCRRLLRGVAALPTELRQRVAVSFIPYPLAPACNPHLQTAPADADPGLGHCRLAEQTLAAQRQDAFWPLFAKVEASPGRLVRQLRRGPSPTPPAWDPTLRQQIDSLAAIPVTAIPTLLWQGQKLPLSFAGLPLDLLLSRLLDLGQSQSVDDSPKDCGC